MTNDLLADRHAVADLVARLAVLLDEERYDELGTVYADDVVLRFPSGEMHGLTEATAMARRRAARYDRMQHINTDVVVDLDGDSASVRSNHRAVHVHTGGRYEAGIVQRFDAARTPAGWRLVGGRAEIVWTEGEDAV